MDTGMIHIYCGDGKGKTSAAIGLAVRAAGWGKKVLFARFLKNKESGELKILDSVSEITVLNPERSYGFYRTLSEEEKKEAGDMYRQLWEKIRNAVLKQNFDVLIIDEFMAAFRYGWIPQEGSVRFLKEEKPKELEIVLTGRDPDERLVELADYVSEIRKVKHPFDRGISARKGIEY